MTWQLNSRSLFVDINEQGSESPKSIGERAVETDILVKRFCEAKSKEVVTYEEMEHITGRNIREDARHLINSARRILRTRHNRVIECVRNVGYKVLDAQGIVLSSAGDLKSVRRKARVGGQKLITISNDEFNALAREEKTDYMARRSVLGVLFQATGKRAEKQIAQAVESSNGVLPLNKTLEFMKKGKPAKEGGQHGR
jgi:hypothetical protein